MTVQDVIAAVVPAVIAPLLARRISGDARLWIAVGVGLAVGTWATFTVQAVAFPAFGVLAVAWGAGVAVDLAEHRLPDVVTLVPLPVFVSLLVPAVVESGLSKLWTILLGAFITAALLFLLAYLNPEGLGLGDVKLGLGTGAALGWVGLGTAMIGLAAAFILMAVISGALLVAKRITRESEIAFGPFMILGVLVAPTVTRLLGG